MVALTVAGLVLAFGGYFITTALRAYARGSNRSELQSQAQVVCAHLVADLRESAVAAVTLQNGGRTEPDEMVAMALRRVEGTLPPDGKQAWRQSVIVYAWDPHTRCVIRREFLSSDPLGASAGLTPTAARRVPEDLLRQMALTPNTSDRVLAREVESLKITAGPDPAVLQPPLEIEIVTARASTSYSNEGERVELVTRVRPRNQG